MAGIVRPGNFKEIKNTKHENLDTASMVARANLDIPNAFEPRDFTSIQ